MLFRALLERVMPRQSPHRSRGGAIRPATQLAVEVLEDRCMPTAMLVVGEATVVEGNADAHNAIVQVSLTEPHRHSVSVNYNTADGSAHAGTDYNAVFGKLTFARNEMTKSILIPVIGNRVFDGDRSFFVRLSNPNGARIADGEGIVTIMDDEPRIQVSGWVDYEGNSGTTLATFTVELSDAYDEAVTVNYATHDDTAIAGKDYVATSGTLSFAPGEMTKTITVQVLGNTITEPDKTFLVTLSGASRNALIIGGQGVGLIVDDDGYYNYGPWPSDYGGYGSWYGY